MANPGYLRSTDGSAANNGSTWALANATMAGAITDSAAGDTIYVSQAHAETQATSLTLTFVGTAAAMNKVVFGNDAAEPPTSLSGTSGSISVTGATNIIVNGSVAWYGGTLSAGSVAANSNTITVGQTDNGRQVWNGTAFVILGTGASGRFGAGAAASANVETINEFNDCTWKFGATSQGFNFNRTVRISGGSIDNTGSQPANLLASTPTVALDCIIERFDASNCATTFNWCASSPAAAGRLLLRNCKAPASWTGDIVSGSIANPSFRAEAYNLDTGASNFKFWIRDYYGSIIQETTIVRTGGASDGDTPLSAKMVTNSNAGYPAGGLRSQPVALRFDSSGASVTMTFEVITDGVTLTNKDLELDVLYLGNSGDNLGALATSVPSIVASSSNLTTSSVTWTTTGLTTPTKQKISVTFTPQQEGVMVAVLTLMKASTTVYVDLQPTVA